MRVRLTEPRFGADLADFLWCAGFIVEREGPEWLRVSLPYLLTGERTAADADLFLALWLRIGIRIWNERRAGAEAVLADEPSAALSA